MGTQTITVTLEEEKKQKILRAAKELFSRFGFKKTTVDEIAEAAGMSKRTVEDDWTHAKAWLRAHFTRESDG